MRNLAIKQIEFELENRKFESEFHAQVQANSINNYKKLFRDILTYFFK